jgi:signal transduction histidine kinase
MKKRYDFFGYLSRASSDLINLEPDQIDNAIVETLNRAAHFANCDFAQVFIVRPPELTSELLLSWTNNSSGNIEDKIRQLEISDFNLIHEYLKAGNIIQVKKSDFETTFDADQIVKYFDPLGIRSMIAIPMLVNNMYIGHIGFQSSLHEITWPDETVNSLRLCSQIIANAISRKQVIQELEKAKRKAEESDQLKTAFLASMSHEIRTPMNHIIGFIELLKDPNLSEQEKNDFFSIIKNSGNHLLKLIDDIIDIAKIEANQLELHPVETSLNDFIKEQYNAFREQLNNGPKSKINFTLKLPAGNVSDFVTVDTLRLQQILTNLLANSIKFTREGSISFGYELQDKSTLRFFVKDTGIGISFEDQQLIFERFRQLDSSYSREFSGTGLGLAISKGLVELLGGTIGVESQPGTGSTFYFTLPYKPLSPVQQQAAIKAKTSGEYNFEGKTILVVEDDEINFRFLEIMLTKTKARVLHANNGQTAVDMALSPDVDLVLMDIQIPVIDGYSATKMVKKERPHLPVIAQTAHALDDERNQCIEAGADAYVAKPINRKQLLLKISNFLLDK